MVLALPLTAAVLLRASPLQMGLITTSEILPFIILSLPAGVLIDRIRKLALYIIGELTLSIAAISVTLSWFWHYTSLDWLCVVAFLVGLVNVTAGSAGQIVVSQIVERADLVEANTKSALARSLAEVAGPGAAGLFASRLGAPYAFLPASALFLFSAIMVSGLPASEESRSRDRSFFGELRTGIMFVISNRLLVISTAIVSIWQLCYNAVRAQNLLVATRVLHMSAGEVGLSYMCLGAGSVLAGISAGFVARGHSPGARLIVGLAICSLGWFTLFCCPSNLWGSVVFSSGLILVGAGSVFVGVGFVSLRQAITPAVMLGRVTSVMRWAIMLPAAPAALLGGWLGEHVSLRAPLGLASITCLLLTIAASQVRALREKEFTA